MKLAFILPEQSTCCNFLLNALNFRLSLNFLFQSFAMAQKNAFSIPAENLPAVSTKMNLMLRVHDSALTTNWKEWFKEHQ